MFKHCVWKDKAAVAFAIRVLIGSPDPPSVAPGSALLESAEALYRPVDFS